SPTGRGHVELAERQHVGQRQRHDGDLICELIQKNVAREDFQVEYGGLECEHSTAARLGGVAGIQPHIGADVPYDRFLRHTIDPLESLGLLRCKAGGTIPIEPVGNREFEPRSAVLHRQAPAYRVIEDLLEEIAACRTLSHENHGHMDESLDRAFYRSFQSVT